MKNNFKNKFVSTIYILLAGVLLLDCGVFSSFLPPKIAGTPGASTTKTSISTPTLAPIPTNSVNDPAAVSVASICRNTVDGLNTLKKGLTFPDHLYKKPLRQDTDFDVNQYFNVLTHLSLSPGYTLDYLYFANGMGGKPLLYARKSADAPFKSYDELLKSINQMHDSETPYTPIKNDTDFLRQVQVDNSADSYYQYVVLALLGSQFYLNWHSNYNDTRILCDNSDLDLINNDLGSFNIKLPQDIDDAAKTIDYRPIVLIGGQTVTVRLVTFSKWGGFTEDVYVLDRQKPHKSTDIKNIPLIKYDVGIAF